MSSSYRIQAATGIHRGDREYQQDQVLLMAHPYAKGCILGVVADGMGGRSGGRKASDQVMLTARQLFERFEPAKEDCIRMLRTAVPPCKTTCAPRQLRCGWLAVMATRGAWRSASPAQMAPGARQVCFLCLTPAVPACLPSSCLCNAFLLSTK